VHLALSTTIFEEPSVTLIAEQTARLGYEGLEVVAHAPHLTVDGGPAAARQVRSALDDHGLVCPCLVTRSGGYSHLDEGAAACQLELLQRHVALAHELGAPLIRQFSGGPSAADADADTWNRATSWFQRAADLLESSRLTLLIETLPGSLCDSVAGAQRLISAIDRPSVGLLLDPANMYASGHAIGEHDILLLARHIRYVHVKDLAPVSQDDSDGPGAEQRYRPALLGDGLLDYPAIILALRNVGFTGFLAVEQGGHEPLLAARHTIAALRALLDRVAAQPPSQIVH